MSLLVCTCAVWYICATHGNHACATILSQKTPQNRESLENANCQISALSSEGQNMKHKWCVAVPIANQGYWQGNAPRTRTKGMEQGCGLYMSGTDVKRRRNANCQQKDKLRSVHTTPQAAVRSTKRQGANLVNSSLALNLLDLMLAKRSLSVFTCA